MPAERSQLLAACGTLLVACTVAPTALAQSQSSTIDTARGPISGSTRRIGLGGAFVAIAEDTDGVASNPASVAVRLPYSWHEWDYGLGLDVAIEAWLPKSDLYYQSDPNNVGESSAFFGSLAAIVYYDHAGFGVSAEAQRNAATRQDQVQGIAPTDLTANFGVMHASLAYGFLDGQLLLGAGARLVGMSFDRHTPNSGPLSTAGVGYEAGVIVKPRAAQYRIAAAVKAPIDAAVAGDAETESSAVVPWEVALGFAYQFGARRLNPPLVTARRLAREAGAGREPSDAQIKAAEDELFERYQKRSRWYLLVSSELAVIQGGGAQGLEQYWSDSDEVAPTRPIISPRLGLESEVVPHILKLRAGSYYEPSRVAQASGRVHGTGGFDVRLFEWSVFGLLEPFDYWQLSLGVDAARSYLNTSLSIGFWH
jgi:hypothetical protein